MCEQWLLQTVMSLESVINSYEHPAALSNGWKTAINHVELFLEFLTNNKVWHSSAGSSSHGWRSFPLVNGISSAQ